MISKSFHIFLFTIFLIYIKAEGQKINRDLIYQTGLLNNLIEGELDGNTPFARMQRLGNFGLGTFHQLDGEMVALRGKIYQIKSDGKVYKVRGGMKTPFTDITHFKADEVEQLNEPLSYAELVDYLGDKLPSRQAFFAIKISGKFKYAKTRSVHKQEKPYPTLAEVIAEQVIFEYEEIRGTMVGFYMPEEVAGISAPGFHFHFISKDKKKGGHMLDCTIDAVKIAIDHSIDLKVLEEKTHGRNRRN